jgi:carboxypeptidase family protein
MRWSAGVGSRLAAAAVAVSMSGVPICFSQAVHAAGTLTGRIFLADGVTPRSGVVVKVANLATSQVFDSSQTDKSGHYALSTLPSGQYQVAVQAGEGLYVNPDRIPVIQGRKTLFSMALNPAKVADDPPAPEPPPQPPPDQPPPAEPPAPQPAPEAPPQTEPPAQQPPAEGTKPEEKKPEQTQPAEKGKTPAEQEAGKKKEKSSGGFWRSGWGVAVGLGGGAIVLGLLAESITGNSNEVSPPPSASTP